MSSSPPQKKRGDSTRTDVFPVLHEVVGQKIRSTTAENSEKGVTNAIPQHPRCKLGRVVIISIASHRFIVSAKTSLDLLNPYVFDHAFPIQHAIVGQQIRPITIEHL
jgi:hypothetical protein